MSSSEKLNVYAVKLRLKSNDKNMVFKPAFAHGIVFCKNRKQAIELAVSKATEQLQKHGYNAKAEPYKTTLIKTDFIIYSN